MVRAARRHTVLAVLGAVADDEHGVVEREAAAEERVLDAADVALQRRRVRMLQA